MAPGVATLGFAGPTISGYQNLKTSPSLRVAFLDAFRRMRCPTAPPSIMKFLAASAVLLSLLVLGRAVHAQSIEESTVTRYIVIGRCMDQPMSLALALTEREAARFSPPRSTAPRTAELSLVAGSDALSSFGYFVAAERSLRGTSPRLMCMTPDDPGCRISGCPTLPEQSHLERVDHGFALPPEPVIPEPPAPSELTHLVCALGSARAGHPLPPWRPPTFW